MNNSAKHTILIVDDSGSTLEVMQRNLSAEGFQAFTAPGVEEAIEILESDKIDLVITDYKMPKLSGLDLVRFIRENYKDTEVMMITGYASVNGAVKAVKAGAEEYLAKPFTDEELISAVNSVLEKLKLKRTQLDDPDIKAKLHYNIIGESEAMMRIFHNIAKAAKTNTTVLITGESGTGKELVARAIHYNSSRSSSAFVPVNCGGIPETLLESELFGHLKGAFTGATESRAGFFQTADGGTIFLDEISETSMNMQVKLLRVLQNKEVTMVGSSRPQKIDVRVIATSNKNLRTQIEKSLFREDLFYRLNVITIDLPPLREREGDIPLLINHFISQYCREFGKSLLQISEKALLVLEQYYWPGNVRELENIIQQLVVMSDDNSIDIPDLPSLMRYSIPRRNGGGKSLQEVEIEHISHILNSVEGNRTQAAKILGIDRKTLRKKLELYHLDKSKRMT